MNNIFYKILHMLKFTHMRLNVLNYWGWEDFLQFLYWLHKKMIFWQLFPNIFLFAVNENEIIRKHIGRLIWINDEYWTQKNIVKWNFNHDSRSWKIHYTNIFEINWFTSFLTNSMYRSYFQIFTWTFFY